MTVFSRGVPLNQVLFTSCIDICLSCLQVGTRGHLFTSTRCLCVVICLQVGTRCLCVVICLQVHVVFTSCYHILQVHVSPRSDVTFGNDVVHHHHRKNWVESRITYYCRCYATIIEWSGILFGYKYRDNIYTLQSADKVFY